MASQQVPWPRELGKRGYGHVRVWGLVPMVRIKTIHPDLGETALQVDLA